MITLFSKPKKEKPWYGPVPTDNERANSQQFINEHLEQWPNSGLAKDFPYNADLAKATKAFRELEARRDSMDPLDYEIELDKISHLIDISEILSNGVLR
jgi:hypothetical protein